MVLINGSEEKLNEIKVIFIHGDQLNYLSNLSKLLFITFNLIEGDRKESEYTCGICWFIFSAWRHTQR